LGKKRRNDHANLTQDMLNELNKHTLPGYEHYAHYPPGYGGTGAMPIIPG